MTSNETMSGNKGINVIAFCDTTTGLNNNAGISLLLIISMEEWLILLCMIWVYFEYSQIDHMND